MIIKQLNSQFSVSDQLTLDDVDTLAASGIRTLVCNRPDGEVSGQPSFADVSERANRHGIAMHYLPVVHDTINSYNVRQFTAQLQATSAPVHAWCRSGLRSVTLWALSQLQQGGDAATVVAQATAQGFDFANFTQKFRGVIAELDDSLLQLPLANHCPLLIVGAGAAGIALAASLLRRNRSLAITLVDPADTHYYQPGFTLVGAGEFNADAMARPMRELIPAGVQWLQTAVTHFLPEHSQVALADGTRLGYDRLFVCPGLKLNWAAIPGLADTLGKNGVTSNYLPSLAPYTWQLVQGLKRGRAVFTQPPMPIKCAGAPQKALYLSASHWERSGTLPDINIEFYNAGAVLFGVKDFVPRYIDRYRAKLHFGHTLVKVDGPAHTATFATTDKDGKATTVDVTFDLLHVVPPQTAPDFVRNSPLADRAGWVDVDKHTLRHRLYANVWGLGDCMNAPNAKTAAAARKQVVVVADNVIRDMKQQPPTAQYQGYGACPLTVERGRVVLAEFGYDGALQPTLPRLLLEGRKPTWLGWVLKKNLMPWIYWQLMLKGREWLAGSAKE
jgi:sulfide:quinone oxidoreductase